MKGMDTQEKTNLEMEQPIGNTPEALLVELQEKARNVEVNKRKEFENDLLKLAQEKTDANMRNAVYEVLVSLQSIWNQFLPEESLQQKFRDAFDAGNYLDAEGYYVKLTKQGLDYIGKFQKGEGRIIPIFGEDTYALLQYNKKEIVFYTSQFEPLEKIPIPESLFIVDVIAPFAHQSQESMEFDKLTDASRQIWILLEDKEGKKSIVSTNMEVIKSLKEEPLYIENRALYLDERFKNVQHLSYFQNHLLLISKETIYYQSENGAWEKWYGTDNEITACELSVEGFWVGHKNGDVIILKNLQYVGVRAIFKGFSYPINMIRGTGRFMMICWKQCLQITDFKGNPVLKPFETQCEIRQSFILNDSFLLMLLANGMLIGRELNQGNICWQINLGDIFEMLFAFKEYVYLGKRDREIRGFEIPPFHAMAKELESKHIYVEKLFIDMEPNSPVKYISDFIGRKEILKEIKEKFDAHFLLFGVPRVGKTSLLNVLRDSLSENAKCCVVDMSQLLKDSDSCDTFQLKFIEECLRQHFMKLSEFPKKGGYYHQAMRSMIAKIIWDRSFCVFSMDNFFIPTHFDPGNIEIFKTFLCSLMLYPDVRIIMTCSSKAKVVIEEYIKGLDIITRRRFITREIPFFSEVEVRNALREKVSLQQSIVDKVYTYTGRFPHLIHFYDRWDAGRQSIEKQSILIAQNNNEKIFEYFRDLSRDARLLIATCLSEKLISEKISYTMFYEKFPFLRNSLPKDQLDKTIEEIDNYGSGLCAKNEAEAFKISLNDNALLFIEAAKHISWIKDFKTLYEFTSIADQGRALKVAHTFTRITLSALDSNEYLEQRTKKYKDKFYINKLTDQGMQALRMPLTTFIVIPFQPWRRELYMDVFQDLHIEFQEFSRKASESIHESASQMFYILLFQFHGVPNEKVKKDLEGFDRISIIDARMMKNIILAENPQDKASEYIFGQLNIKERSPYTTAGAVPDNLFFGRQMEIALIRGLPENIGIFGTRTIGKTSLLTKLHKAFRLQKQWKVYSMDCSRIESEESLLENLAEKMEIKAELISDLDKFRRYVTKDAEAGEHRFLFLLDEVDRLVQYDIRNDGKIFDTFNRLCNETMRNNESAARFILFGFQQMFEQMKNPLSRLYNFMVFMPLKPLDMEGAMSLVTRPMENIRVRWLDKKDAEYLVDSCSNHPRLLQAACHALLTILDSKVERRDIIEHSDVDNALTSSEFRELCMRFYHDHKEEKGESGDSEKKKKVERKNTFFSLKRGKDNRDVQSEAATQKRKGFLSDFHRITILAAIRLLFEEHKESFTLTSMHEELKSYNIDVTPNMMRNILDQLCLSGIFRLRDESTILTKEGTEAGKDARKISSGTLPLTVGHPEVYKENETTFPKFSFEFGVKIFPRLLVAHFDGLKQCEEERDKLIKQGDWQEWLRKY